MRDIFPAFYSPTEDQYNSLWKKAIFALDANVLLNLYRYPTEASSETLRIFSLIKDRLFVPYHAALEYQRNRLSVIAEQKRRYGEVRAVVEDIVGNANTALDKLQVRDRHPVIDPDGLISKMRPIVSAFLEDLEKAEAKQPDVMDSNPIREQLDKLLQGRVGTAPDQNWVDETATEGAKRFERLIPPGYVDGAKDRSDAKEFTYGGIVYQLRYGDLFVWKQVIDKAKSAESDVIFVTDDVKEDWYWHANSRGTKRMGPRPELIDEFSRLTGGQSFYMYGSGQFLKYSKEYLKSEASEETIDAVRVLSSRGTLDDLRALSFVAEDAVSNWLTRAYPDCYVVHNKLGWPDLLANESGGRRIGVDVIIVRSPMAVQRLLEKAYRAFHAIQQQEFDEFAVIAVVPDGESPRAIADRISRMKDRIPEGVQIRLGQLVPSESSRSGKEYLPLL